MEPPARRYVPDLPLPQRPYHPGPGLPRPRLPLPPLPAPPQRVWRAAGDLPPQAARHFRYGVDLFNAGCGWEAHEAWEGLWRRTERGTGLFHLLQGLILLAAAALKAARRRAAVARGLEGRALAHLQRGRDLLAAPRPLGLELERLLAELAGSARAEPAAAAILARRLWLADAGGTFEAPGQRR